MANHETQEKKQEPGPRVGVYRAIDGINGQEITLTDEQKMGVLSEPWVCPRSCGGDFLYIYALSGDQNGGVSDARFRCPCCEIRISAFLTDEVVSHFDDHNDEVTAELVVELGRYSRLLMDEEISKFVNTLEHVLPEDF